MKNTDENIEKLFGGLEKGQPFRVPENYFETFADRLKERISEEEQTNHRKRSLYFYLKPVLMAAASIVLVMLLVNIPMKKFLPSGNNHLANAQTEGEPLDSIDATSVSLISYFSEGQFLAAVTDMKELEADTLSTDNLAEFIATNYDDYEIIASN